MLVSKPVIAALFLSAALIGSGLGVGLAQLVGDIVLVAPLDEQTNTPAHRIYPGVPYIERDGAVTLVCVSDRPAWSYPPLVR